MPIAEMLTTDLVKTIESVGDQAKGHFNAMIETAFQYRRHQSDITMAMTDNSKSAVESVIRLSAFSVNFARKLVEHEASAVKKFASVKSPTDLLQVQGDYVRSSINLFVTELTASTSRFVDTVGEMTAERWPIATAKASVAA